MPPTGDPEWADALAAFDDVVGLDAGARQSRLDAIGASDPALRGAVEQLLAMDSWADTILKRVDAALDERLPDGDQLHLVGRTVSHFRIVEPVARGGMGVVYRAEDLELGRTVALKVPLATRYVGGAARERFRQEARAAGALDHPNLCPVYETGETADGDLFYTMPFYDGETLKARLAREGRLPFAQALEVAAQLARGLGAAHSAGIVHRDLKPANVMLLPDGAVKILDFGLAKERDLTLTGSWARLGTVSYMAPEQVRGHKVGPRADLWALGVVLHEMVTGTRPFRGGDEIGVAHAIVYDSPPRASALLDDVPPELDDVIDRCLRKEAAGRFESAEELATALEGIRLDRGPPYLRKLRRARVRLGRHRRRVAFTSVATVGLLAAAGVELARRGSTAMLAPVSLAVLPFDRVGDSITTQHLAVGLSDAIGTDLSRLSRMVVPGYVTTSVYRGSSGSVKQIAAEQRVGAVLHGSVQRVGDRVRVDAQLLDTGRAQPLWARRFERPESELPALERDLVWAVVSSLGVHPTREERSLLDHPATRDARAYDLFLQGREVELAGRSRDILRPVPIANIRAAQALYSRSRDTDPGFAAARARLALMHMLAATTYDTTAARRTQARVEAEAALRLEPRLPEPHEALASSWAMEGDVPKAIAELGRALAVAPNRADPHQSLANILMEAGRYEDAAAECDSATRLEPGNPYAAFAAATTHGRLRRREIAIREFNRAIALAPGDYMIRVIRGQAYIRYTGIPDTLAATMRDVPEEWDPMGMATYARFTASWAQRRYAEGLAALGRSRSELSRDLLTYEPKPLMRARLQEALGQREGALASYRIARSVILDSVAANPTNPNMRIALGLAYAGLGRGTEAVREARRAMELEPIARRTDEAMAVIRGAVEVFAKAGEKDAAFGLLELLFSMPAGREATVPFLRVWPGFDPLRSDPRFEELLTRFAVPPVNGTPGGRR